MSAEMKKPKVEGKQETPPAPTETKGAKTAGFSLSTKPTETPVTNQQLRASVVATLMKPGLSFGISEAVLITIATAFAYLAAYNYEVGVCSRLGIPEGFIRVSLETLIKSSLASISFVFLMITFAEPIIGFYHYLMRFGRKHFAIQWLCVNLAVYAFFALLLSIFAAEKNTYLVALKMQLGLQLVAVVAGAIAYICLKIDEKIPKKYLRNDVTQPFRIGDFIGFRVLLLFSCAFFVSLFARLAGEKEIIDATVYNYIPSLKYYIVRSYGDNHACKPGGKAPDSFADTTIILTTEQISKLEIESVSFYPKRPKVEEAKRKASQIYAESNPANQTSTDKLVTPAETRKEEAKLIPLNQDTTFSVPPILTLTQYDLLPKKEEPPKLIKVN